MKKALLIVDVQNDFCPGGTLAVPNGDQVIKPLNRVAEYARANGWVITASRDWHPRQTTHFEKFGGRWPVHCVQNTYGAEFHPSLRLPSTTVVISKGIYDDGYSLFEGFHLRKDGGNLVTSWFFLNNCDEVYIGGLATDYCVKATALDAVKNGLKTYLLFDACRAVNINPGDGDRAIEEMIRAGVIITTTDKVLR